MTRGIYNEDLDSWLQDFAEINGVMIIADSDDDSVYRIDYNTNEVDLQVRKGLDEEIATVIREENGYLDEFSEIVEKAGYELDFEERKRPVVMEK